MAFGLQTRFLILACLRDAISCRRKITSRYAISQDTRGMNVTGSFYSVTRGIFRWVDLLDAYFQINPLIPGCRGKYRDSNKVPS